ncbi:MAG: serine/threonine protein kinase [Deltaproteobacteria bacterium]|nr:serine/threonine protein kinase [Deltaproteobacteria bacterium]
MKQDTLIGYNLGGRFVVEQLLDQEWLGKVYAARARSGELVSVKVLDPHMVEDPAFVGRFGREMMATAAVESPHTVKMIDFGEHSIFHYLVLEYLVSDTVRHVLEEQGPFSEARATSLAVQVAQGLSVAHTQGLVHRNLTPESVILLRNVRGGDFAKIKDFGLSRLQDEFNETLTSVGTRVGNPRYMAPEYIEEETFDHRGDLYALGIVLFEVLSGKPPYDDRSPGRLLNLQVTAAVPRLSEVGVKVSPWLEDLVFDLMAKSPAARPQSAQQVIERVVRGLGHMPPEGVVVPLGHHGEVPEGVGWVEPAGSSRGGGSGMVLGAVGIGMALALVLVLVLGAVAFFVLF